MPLPRRAQVVARLALALLAALPFGAAAAYDTAASASTSAGIGLDGVGDYLYDAHAGMASEAATQSTFDLPGVGRADARMQSWAEAGRLRTTATVQVAAPYSNATAGSRIGTDADTAAYFQDTVLVAGPPGAHELTVFYRLSGVAGVAGGAAMDFVADLSLRAHGTGVTIVGSSSPPVGFGDVFVATVTGTGDRAFSETGYVRLSVLAGSAVDLEGFLGGYLHLRESGDTAAPSVATLDLSHTGLFYIVASAPETLLVSSSGYDYLAPVPEPAKAALLAVALPLLLAWRRRRRA